MLSFSSSYISPTFSYQRFTVQGFLKKKAKDQKFFQKGAIYKRYFVLDHSASKMRIHQSNDPRSSYKIVKYSEIQAASMKPLTFADKTQIQERWSFEFELQTSERNFTLMASSHDERYLWLHTFHWIIEINFFYTHLLLQENLNARRPQI